MIGKFLENSKHLYIHGIVVLQNGEKIAEHHWTENIRRNQHSVTKSFTSTAVGIAIDEGLLTLDDKVIDFFPSNLPINSSKLQVKYLNKLTIKDLLMMAAGYEEGKLMEDRKTLHDPDWVKFSLSAPLISAAKEKFRYTNCTAYLAGVIVEKVTGCSLIDYLMPRLFEPLGIQRPGYELCPLGHVFGSSGLMLTVNELSKFGQLYLQKGVYNGNQLISKEWVEQATKKQIDTYKSFLDGSMGYGYFFWRGCNNSYRASGRLGQDCIVLEDKNAVIAINANEENSQEIRDCIWDNIYPML
ncbi:serine hydrolase domain-containing protein [Clostridium sp. FP1]|uniref:serine hydrolase domain-containing protein n=1 Tax=Clostridium sp. FP1 TaxID=2724076 RepID=UPI0013E93A82|nr:serine hydrolase [Clostridium sp. FP1]MBZ9637327.1 beta-lactamase family protein [Clostridium sp. FP1]